MTKKLLHFLISTSVLSNLYAGGDVSLKYGLTSLENNPDWNFKNHTLAADVTFDLGYAIKPRLDLNYVKINDSAKWGGASALVQGALDAQFEKTFDLADFTHRFYLFGGLGYEYVADGHDTFDSLPFFQAGLGAKYAINEAWNIVAEFKGMQVFDSNNNSDDEDNEFTFLLGVNFPFGGVKKETRTAVKEEPAPKPAPIAVAPAATEIVDADRDGVDDSVDKCPHTVLVENMIIDENGCGHKILIDSDKDGITDDLDQCPDTKSGTKVDIRGCAKAINLHINFASNSATILPDSQAKVAAFATFMKSLPKESIAIIYGYTDSSGDAAKNKELSRKRAYAVRKALIKAGIEKRRVRAYGKGSTNPIASNETTQGRAQNRRIEAVIQH